MAEVRMVSCGPGTKGGFRALPGRVQTGDMGEFLRYCDLISLESIYIH